VSSEREKKHTRTSSRTARVLIIACRSKREKETCIGWKGFAVLYLASTLPLSTHILYISALGLDGGHVYCIPALHSCTLVHHGTRESANTLPQLAGPPWPVSYQLRGICFTMQVQT
jgi:hypothetical protein